MGCDIHCFAERRNERGQWEALDITPFDYRSYSLFGFLADVRNYSGIKPISDARGMPADASGKVYAIYSDRLGDGHSHSWLSVDELTAFDYEALTEDRRCTRQTAPNAWNNNTTCSPGDGIVMTYRSFLGEAFFEELRRLQSLEAERIVFWFDN